MSRVLIIEDDRDIAELVAMYLRQAGHETDMLESGLTALDRARETSPGVIVLDVMLPGRDGWEVCRALRADPATRGILILMLTARADEADRVAGLELGADDYVVKPFSPRELVARVAALLRRAGRDPAARVLRYGPLSVDLDRHVVTDTGREVHLTAKEFLLLQYLIEHTGRVVSRDALLTEVWGYNYTGGTRTVDVHVRRIREKLPMLASAIATVKQFGYKLLDPGTAST
jgi:DNA-binding response OmpR family regulator